MYLLDPVRGRRRRHLLEEKSAKYLNRACTLGRKAARRIGNRARGIVAELSQPIRPVTDDRVLNDRVRSEFGRKVTHASSIESEVEGGVVKLSGPILENEVYRLLRCVARVPGVKGVVSHLDVHKTSGSIPSLQGTGKRYLH